MRRHKTSASVTVKVNRAPGDALPPARAFGSMQPTLNHTNKARFYANIALACGHVVGFSPVPGLVEPGWCGFCPTVPICCSGAAGFAKRYSRTIL